MPLLFFTANEEKKGVFSPMLLQSVLGHSLMLPCLTFLVLSFFSCKRIRKILFHDPKVCNLQKRSVRF